MIYFQTIFSNEKMTSMEKQFRRFEKIYFQTQQTKYYLLYKEYYLEFTKKARHVHVIMMIFSKMERRQQIWIFWKLKFISCFGASRTRITIIYWWQVVDKAIMERILVTFNSGVRRQSGAELLLLVWAFQGIQQSASPKKHHLACWNTTMQFGPAR